MPATLKSPEKSQTAAPEAEPDYLAQAVAEELGADADGLLPSGEADPSEAEGKEEGEETTEAEKTRAEGDEPDADGESRTEEPSKDGEESDESDAEESAEEEEEEEPKDKQSKLPQSVQKRIDGLTAEKKRLAEKLERAEQDLATAKATLDEIQRVPVQVQPHGNDPLADVLDDAALTQKVQNARAIKRWALEHPEGGTVKNAQGEDVEVSAEQVRQHLIAADELLTEHAPRKAAYLRDLASHETVARETYPDLFDPKSAMFREAVETLRAMPELMRFPDWKLSVGDFITARRARLEKAKADSGKGKTPQEGASGGGKTPVPLSKAAARSTTPVAPRVTEPTPVKRPATKPQAADKVRRAVESGGDVEALEAAFMD